MILQPHNLNKIEKKCTVCARRIEIFPNICLLLNVEQKLVIKYTDTLQTCYWESGLSQKYAFIKKSTIFTQSLRNLVKIRYSWVAYLPQVSQWLGKNCGFFNKSIFLAQSGFSVACLYISVRKYCKEGVDYGFISSIWFWSSYITASREFMSQKIFGLHYKLYALV